MSLTVQLCGETLVIMAKYPEPGSVKTRLARSIGNGRACDLYRGFLLDLADRFGANDRPLIWAVHPPGADLATIVGSCLSLPQRGPDLGKRMAHVFRTLFGAGARRVVMIGADAPHLSRSDVDTAFRHLDEADVTLVPTRDGGYCLVGLRAPHDLFSSVPMGTHAVCRQTMEQARTLGLRVRLLPESFDVDEPEDIPRLARLIEMQPGALPHTAAVLSSLTQSRT